MIAPTWGELNEYRRRLVPSYIDYCTNVSKRSMAISIETAAAFWAVCVQTDAKTVADLGSGYTSFVARLYASEAAHPVEVSSVDDNDFWLDKTREFLEAQQMQPDGLYLDGEWRTSPTRCDVIIHDISAGAVREEWMTVAAEHLAPGGVLIFDDMQNDSHRAEMFEVANRFGFEAVDIRGATLDEVGRFALMVLA